MDRRVSLSQRSIDDTHQAQDSFERLFHSPELVVPGTKGSAQSRQRQDKAYISSKDNWVISLWDQPWDPNVC